MHLETRTRAAFVLVLASTSIVAAQAPAVFRTSTDVVLVPISVTDRNGRFVRGLTSDHFQISDGGTRRAVKQFSAERDTRRAIELLLTRLGAEGEVLFAVFNEQAKASPWTLDHRKILGTFDLLRPGGGTALVDAVKQIASVFHIARHQRFRRVTQQVSGADAASVVLGLEYVGATGVPVLEHFGGCLCYGYLLPYGGSP